MIKNLNKFKNPSKQFLYLIKVGIVIKNNNFNFCFRYKIVCIVEIGEKKCQGIMSIARFLRDFNKDKYVYSNFENHNLFATIMVGAFYYE